MRKTENINIVSEEPIPTPRKVKEQIRITEAAARFVTEARATIRNILDHKDNRMLIVAGPCSIHDVKAALEYALKFRELARKVEDKFMLVMRVYFEKPRTTTGWKGFINDPFLDESFLIGEGLFLARKLLLDLAELGMPAATEALDPIMPQYLGDLISWTAIGARTIESQTHREMASGLSTPVGMKNGTDGNLDVAINGIKAASRPHRFLGITQDAQSAVFETAGNKYGHIVLRGGKKPNYERESLNACEEALKRAELFPNMMVDCSHGNSRKDATKQKGVFEYCIAEAAGGRQSLIGLMLESNLCAGKQNIAEGPSKLSYGVSVTDACIGWEETEQLIIAGARGMRTSSRSD